MLDTMLSNDILVYDWSGKCICRLVTDIKLFNICVTNDDKELIAWAGMMIIICILLIYQRLHLHGSKKAF